MYSDITISMMSQVYNHPTMNQGICCSCLTWEYILCEMCLHYCGESPCREGGLKLPCSWKGKILDVTQNARIWCQRVEVPTGMLWPVQQSGVYPETADLTDGGLSTCTITLFSVRSTDYCWNGFMHVYMCVCVCVCVCV